MKKLTAILCTILFLAVMPLSVYARTMLIGDVDGDGKVTAQDARLILRIAAGLEAPLGEVEVQDIEPSTNQDTYHIGETWRVAGQWELTITAVEETADRNEFSDKNPAAVYMVYYTYKNIGYVDEYGIWDGLYMNLDGTIVDSTGKTGYLYPLSTRGGDELPIGVYCEASECFGVDNAGNLTILLSKYDSNSNKQSATFVLEVE